MSMERLTAVFRDVFEKPDLILNPKMSAKDVDNWDSFNHINLVASIETEFSVSFTTDEIADLQNVGDLIELLKSKGVEISW